MRKIRLRLVIMAICWLVAQFAVLADDQNFSLVVPDKAMTDNAGTVIAKGSGFVQFIKGSPVNPPTGVADTSSPHFSGTDSYAQGVDPKSTIGDIKGKVGDYPGFAAGDGGFAVSNMFNHSIGTTYYVRYWTPGGTYYGNSAVQTPWASGYPVPTALTYASFTLYKAAAPFSPTVNKVTQQDTTNQVLYPALSGTKSHLLSFDVSGADASGSDKVEVKGDAANPPYYLIFKKGSAPDWTSGSYDQKSSSFTVDRSADPLKTYFSDLTASYYVRAVAFNYFGNTQGPAVSFIITGEAGAGGGGVGGAATTFTYNLKRVMSTGFGINSFSVPAASTTVGAPGTSVDGATVATAFDFCDAVNKIYGKGTSQALVRTFGYWDEAIQIENGVTITYSGGAIDSASQTALAKIKLQPGRGYQVFLKPDVDTTDVTVSFTLK